MRLHPAILYLLLGFGLATGTATPSYAVMEDYPSVQLQGLDKSVGKTVTFDAKVGSTIQYGSLYVKIHACRKSPPIEKPESAAFLQIWEVPPGEKKSVWVFSGWMFASSPALSAMDHSVYDIWVLNCTGRDEEQPITPYTNDDAQGQQNTDIQTTPEVMDSEAEPDDSMPPVSKPAGEIPSPMVDPNAAYVPPAQPVPVQSANPDGFTAYDLMKNQPVVARPVTPSVPSR